MAISNSVLAVVSAAALCAGTFSMKAISGTILNFSGTDPALIGDMYPVESLGVIGTLDVDLDTPASFTGTTFNTYADAVIAMDIEVFDINDNSLGTIQATGGDVRIDDSGQVGLLQILNFESYTGLPTGTFQQRVMDNVLFNFQFPEGSLDGRSLDKVELINDPNNFNQGTLNFREGTVILDQFNVGEPYATNRVSAPGTFAILARGMIGMLRMRHRVFGLHRART